MKRLLWRVAICHVMMVLFMGVAALRASAQQPDIPSVGFKEIIQDGVAVGIWCPSGGPITRKTLGPFDVSYADNGNPLNGFYPIVLISHGIGGQYRNHHLTATRLVQDGNVVIAPTHARDLQVNRSATISRMEFRQHDLTAALVAVTSDPLISRVVNLEKVRAVGYSLGSASVLIASGARFDTQKLVTHCDKHSSEDRNFCSWVTPGFWRSVWDWLAGDEEAREGIYETSTPLLTGDIVLVAPIGQGLDLARVNETDSKIQVLALGGDREVVPLFHAKPLMTTVAFDKINYIEYPNVHH